jgi:hypothetical protein
MLLVPGEQGRKDKNTHHRQNRVHRPPTYRDRANDLSLGVSATVERVTAVDDRRDSVPGIPDGGRCERVRRAAAEFHHCRAKATVRG